MVFSGGSNEKRKGGGEAEAEVVVYPRRQAWEKFF